MKERECFLKHEIVKNGSIKIISVVHNKDTGVTSYARNKLLIKMLNSSTLKEKLNESLFGVILLNNNQRQIHKKEYF